MADINGHKLSSWNDVINREYEPSNSRTMAFDTSMKPLKKLLSIFEYI